MKYRGAYDGSTSYSVGDAVVFPDDGIAYYMIKSAAAGTKPHDLHYWNRVAQPLQEIILMFHGMFSSLNETKAAVDKVIFDDKTLVLASSTEDSDKVYTVTIEDGDSGGEMVIAEVEDEEADS